MATQWNQKSGIESGEKRHVVLGITGSIAAYKSAEVTRLLVSWGFEVRVVMTESAQQFITPLTLASLSGNPVVSEFWTEEELEGIGHIQIADWADTIVVAPASADFIAKLAAGFAENPLLAICLASKAKIIVAPAMNVNMYENEATKKNLETLRSRGIGIIDPEVGELACGWTGSGRLASAPEIFYEVRRALTAPDLTGKHIVITTGPTREYIDPVRFISNRSSGKMGVALAREAYRRGAKVTVIHGPVPTRVPRSVTSIEVTSAQEMQDALIASLSVEPKPDIVIMAAAVADVRSAVIATEKLKKKSLPPSIPLVQNPDILGTLGEHRGNATKPLLVGFAVETGETEDLVAEARRKLETKHVDLIVGNFAAEAFELDTNRVWLIDRNGKQEEVATSYKSRIANKILDATLKL